MNLADLREAVRIRTGYPERGDTGDKRLNNLINQALRKLWGEVPDVLLREEFRFALEPPGSITVAIDTTVTPSRTLTSTATTSDFPEGIEQVVARWIELQDENGNWIQRRIVAAAVSAGSSTFYIDDPVTTTDFTNSASISAKVYTKEYPYPADVQQIRDVVLNPESNPRQLLRSRFGPEIRRAKLGLGWQDTGQIQFYSRGDFFQLPAPNYAPAVSPAEQIGHLGIIQKWGYDSSGSEQIEYGPAGTFSYRVCHVWGDWPNRTGNAAMTGITTIKKPFYISSVSKSTTKIGAKWGASSVKIELPNIEYLYGYGRETSDPAYKKHGIKRFVFRARHATETTISAPGAAGSTHGSVPADGVYYLWQSVDGDTTEVYDNGSYDPVAINYPLKEFVGHQHVRFDKRPSVGDHVLVSCIRRPSTLRIDTDAPRVPPECYGALIELCCSFLIGDRDGDLKRKSFYHDAYLLELGQLKRIYSFSGHERPSFGDGMSTSHGSRNTNYPVEEA